MEIGTEVRLMAGAGGGPLPRPLLTGSVTALEVEIDDTGTFTVVRGLDESHRLFRGRQVASYQNMTLADICVRVARRAGLKPGKVDVAGPVLEHVAQPNISDWEFLRGLAEEAGAQVYVTDGRLHIAKPTEAGGAPDTSARAARDPLVLEMGDNLLRCRAGVSAAEQVSTVEVRGWDVKTKQPLVGRADAGTAATLDLGVTAAEVARPFGEASFVVSDAPYGHQAQVDQAAGALAARIAGSFAELEAVIRGNPEVRAGGAVTLAGVGKPFEGRYTVTSSRHVFDPVRGYETWVTVSGQQERSLFGRFPWLSDEYASDWARTAQAGGTGGGEAFIPEVGDEVLIGFEQGHLDRPYVLAGLYNGKHKPGQGQGTSGQGQGQGLGPQQGRGDGQEAAAVDPTARSTSARSAPAAATNWSCSTRRTARRAYGWSRGTLELGGATVKLTARGGVQVDGGNGQVKLSTGGAVEVRGNQVAVSGTTRTELKGGDSLSVNAPMVRIY
ncbi:VgrG-related protein [Streptomyces sp. 6N106]|uniref:VgrG-related protein n=1 Tax=Streptomyces sp. 6N106 TaxID=3457418 RepID=UPI003FD5B21D